VIGIVLVSHGGLAAGMLDAMQMIVGEQEAVAHLALHETDDVDTLVDRVGEAVDQVAGEEGTLILVDLFGASPFNASSRLAMSRGRQIEVLTGLNLPMLVELVIQRDGLTLKEAAALARQSGLGGIRTLSETLGGKSPASS
jgi:PTS system mannose-specific IIA component